MKWLSFFKTPSIILLVLISLNSTGQDPLRFKNDINRFRKMEIMPAKGKKKVVFTGSSSITNWTDVQNYFPEVFTINTGFGGSTMSDLLAYVQETIIRFKPDKVFIYEGDNDIAGGTSVHKIISLTRSLIQIIKEKLPDTEIIIISPKPSIERWELKNEYLRLNESLERFCHSHDIKYANIWEIMLNEKGEPRKDIFLADGLHMNKKGYVLWQKVLKEYMN